MILSQLPYLVSHHPGLGNMHTVYCNSPRTPGARHVILQTAHKGCIQKAVDFGNVLECLAHFSPDLGCVSLRTPPTRSGPPKQKKHNLSQGQSANPSHTHQLLQLLFTTAGCKLMFQLPCHLLSEFGKNQPWRLSVEPAMASDITRWHDHEALSQYEIEHA